MNKPYEGRIRHLHLLGGAREARGLSVIIDVFRAFSLESYLYAMGAKEIRPVGPIEDTLSLHKMFPGSVLIGERKGVKCEGFDFGNSPSQVRPEAVKGKCILHTTSAGTQGIIAAENADELLTGSFTTASAIAEYIKKRNPKEVSLVSMGSMGTQKTPEDELCAEYIACLLRGESMPDLEEKLLAMRENGAEKFFDPAQQSVFPEQDFWMCIRHDIFDFVLRIQRDEYGFIAKRIEGTSTGL